MTPLVCTLYTQVQKSGYWALKDAGKELQSDPEIVLQAVQQDGMALQHAGEELKGDRDMVMEAVRKNGCALEFASKVHAKTLPCILRGGVFGGGCGAVVMVKKLLFMIWWRNAIRVALTSPKKKNHTWPRSKNSPTVGLEPTTTRLTALRSAN